MASFSDLYNTYGPDPVSWQQYPLQLQGEDLRTEVGLQAFRARRDFEQYQLPDLMSSYAAKGAYHTGARKRAASTLGERYTESVGDMARRAGISLQDLATQQVGTNIGANFGG
jgi:hypothetical protein